MKKRSIGLLCLCIALVFVACKGKNVTVNVTDNSNKTTEPTKKPTEEPTKKPDVVEPSASVQPTNDEDIRPVYRIMHNYGGNWDEDKQMSFICCAYDTIQIASKDFPELATQLDKWNSQKAKAPTELEKISRVEYEVSPEYWDINSYTIDSDCDVRRADSKVFSFVDIGYYAQGGAHGQMLFEAHNYDTKTGNEILITDVVKDSEKLAEVLEEKLHAEYKDLSFNDMDLSKYIMETYLSGSSTMGSKLQFTLGYKQISFYFSHYELTNYAEGTQEVTLTSDEYPELFQTEYCTYVARDYAYRIYAGADNRLDINDDGTIDNIFVTGSYDTETETYSNVSVKINETTVTKDTHSFNIYPYYVKTNSKSYLYVQLTSDNDSKAFMVFDVTSGGPVYVDTAYGELLGFSNPNYFYIEEKLDMLSTYEGIRLYHIADNGMPVSDSAEYEATVEYSLKSTVELKGQGVDSITGEMGGEEVFPAGTEFTIIATDNRSYVKMKAGDGRIAKFIITPEWPQKINGKDAEQCFEQLYFAG